MRVVLDTNILVSAMITSEPRNILEGWPTFPAGLGDPNMTFRHEEIYDDDGR